MNFQCLSNFFVRLIRYIENKEVVLCMSLKNIDGIQKVVLQKVIQGYSIEKKSYHSTVYEILSEYTLKIIIPKINNELIFVHINEEYDVHFYCETGVYKSLAKIIDSYMLDDCIYLLLKLLREPYKYQRREFYRCKCLIDMKSCNLTEKEILNIQSMSDFKIYQRNSLNSCVILDISGGGIRFISQQKYEVDRLIYCVFEILKDKQREKIELAGRVLSVKELKNKIGSFEHRIKYYKINERQRDKIIKFIFENENKKVRRIK